MKALFVCITFLIQLAPKCQSPYTSIKVLMDSSERESKDYKIEMKICDPTKKTNSTNWFTPDTSKIDFTSLKTGEINCGKYLYNGEGIEVLSGDNPYEKFNTYLYQNQLFAWEKIFIFKISDHSSRGWWPEMYIVLPVRYKSFITYIELNDLSFQSGKVIFLTDINATANKARSEIIIHQSLKNVPLSDVENFSLKALLTTD